MEHDLKPEKKIEITKLLLLTLSLFGGLGVVATYLYLTDSVAFKHKPASDEYECQIHITKDVKGKFVVFEDGVCSKYINYKNLPDDTTVYGRDDGSLENIEIGE